MEAALGVYTAAIVADSTIRHTLIQVSALRPGCGGLESGGTLTDVRARGVHTLSVFTWAPLTFIRIDAFFPAVQPESHVALAAVPNTPRCGDAPAVQAEVAVGLAHVGDVLGLDNGRTWGGQYRQLSRELSWDLSWILSWNLDWDLSRTLTGTLNGDLTWIHLTGGLARKNTWVDARNVRTPRTLTWYGNAAVPIGYLDAEFLVLLCSTNGAHLRCGSIGPAASAVAAALHFGQQPRILVGATPVQQASVAVAAAGIYTSGPIHSSVISLGTLAKVAANSIRAFTHTAEASDV